MRRLFLEVTMDCNFDCDFCYQKKERSKPRKEMNFHEVVRLIDDVNPEEIVITGGEPLVRNDIFDILDAIEKRKIGFKLYTNGMLLDDEKIRKLKGYGFLKEVHLSIDGKSAGHGAIFDSTLELIDRLKGIKKISFTTVINENNYKELKEIINIAKEKGINFTLIPEESASGDEITRMSLSLGLKEDEILLNEEEHSKRFRNFVDKELWKICKEINEAGKNVHAPAFFRKKRDFGYYDSSLVDGIKCKALDQPQLRFDSAGNFVFCRQIRRKFKGNVDEVLGSKEYWDFLDKVENNGKRWPICKRCIKAKF